MNDTPVPSSVQPTQVPQAPVLPVGDGYIDPLAQVPAQPAQTVPVQAASPADQTIHTFTPQVSEHGSLHKEFAPRPRVQEIVSGHESRPEIAPQVAEAGVEHSPEIMQEQNLQSEIAKATQDLTSQLQTAAQMNVTAAEPEPVFPLSTTEAEEAIKTANVDSGRRWFATEVLKQIKERFKTKQTDPL